MSADRHCPLERQCRFNIGNYDPSSIYFVDANTAYSVGTVGEIIKTTNATQIGIEENETAQSLANKIHKLEYAYYPAVIEKYLEINPS